MRPLAPAPPAHLFHGALKRKDEKERPGALLARRTRALGRASFDARSKGQPRPLPLRKSIRSQKALVDTCTQGISPPLSLKMGTGTDR